MIRTNYYSIDSMKPSNIIRDHRGTLIEKGLKVAYNYQGQVRIGTIIELIKNYYRKRPNSQHGWTLEFELLVSEENGNINSRIKNPNSFVII